MDSKMRELLQAAIDKTQNGIARVDRRAVAEVTLETALPVRAARELTAPAKLAIEGGKLRVSVPAGDLKVIELDLK